jgi:hypothetical protein
MTVRVIDTVTLALKHNLVATITSRKEVVCPLSASMPWFLRVDLPLFRISLTLTFENPDPSLGTT